MYCILKKSSNIHKWATPLMKGKLNMRNKKLVLTLTQTSLLAAIIVIMSFTPLGYIPLVVVKATILQVPVIIGSILLGPKIGAVLGGVFGLTSVLQNTIAPTSALSFLFTPFAPSPFGIWGGWQSLIIAIVPRILVGIIPYFVCKWISKLFQNSKAKHTLSLSISAIAGALVNTLFVMGFAGLFFTEKIGDAVTLPAGGVMGFILTVIFTNGIAEMIVSAVIVTAVLSIKPILKMNERQI